MNNVISLYKRPVGKPTLGDFSFTEEEMPVSHHGEVLIKTLYVSVDPYLRGRMNDSKSYVLPFALGKPLQSGSIAEVVESSVPQFKKGDFVMDNLDWKEYQVSTGKGLVKIDTANCELSKYLGILGMTGLTAYFGLIEIADPKEGETIVVSGAAGAVGSVAGQIGKIRGCHVVGITGSDEKATLLKSKFKFDAAINYKSTGNLDEAIKKACPNGVDVYFDNVGGEISDAVLRNINKHARISICGAISLYNETRQPVGPRVQPLLLTNSATMRGFIISDFSHRFEEGIMHLTTWLKEGKLTYTETIVEGFDKLPQVFIDLFEGKNEGKMIVKV
jgi:NADPH-dependent curcumin reductase CurA